MPLIMAAEGDTFTIKRVTGKEEIRKHLETLGFVAGAVVSVVSDIGGNLIVNIKESRIALDKSLASKIMV